MDVRKIFQGVSTQLSVDFEVSANMGHQGVKGSYREGALKKFLSEKRLPEKYGVGSGEICSSVQQLSKQCDLIIYNKFEAIPLIYDEGVQVYPIEAVYGVVEVKSRLNKTELLKGLENIKSVKEQTAFGDQGAFGIIFSYALSENSLESLLANLKEWEGNNSKKYWPNMVVVLGVGVIIHTGVDFKICTGNSEIAESIDAICIHYGCDALFQFYSTLLDLSSSRKLPAMNLKRYYSPSQRIDNYVVQGHEGFEREGVQGRYRIKADVILKVIAYCNDVGPISYGDLLAKQYGEIEFKVSDSVLSAKVYLYDPDGLPNGNVQELIGSELDKKEYKKSLASVHSINIDGKLYAVPLDCLNENDYELM